MKIKPEELLELICSGKYIQNLTKKTRKEGKIPSNGFASRESVEHWKEDQFKNETFSEKYKEAISSYRKKIFKRLAPFNIEQDSRIIDDLLLLRNIDFSYYKDIVNNSMFKIYGNTRDSGPGVYIKINPFANLTDLRSFVAKNSPQIKDMQKTFKSRINKLSADSKDPMGRRSYYIYTLNFLDDQQIIDAWNLEPMPYAYRNELISRALKKEGFGYVSSDVIKKTLSLIKRGGLI